MAVGKYGKAFETSILCIPWCAYQAAWRPAEFKLRDGKAEFGAQLSTICSWMFYWHFWHPYNVFWWKNSVLQVSGRNTFENAYKITSKSTFSVNIRISLPLINSHLLITRGPLMCFSADTLVYMCIIICCICLWEDRPLLIFLYCASCLGSFTKLWPVWKKKKPLSYSEM